MQSPRRLGEFLALSAALLQFVPGCKEAREQVVKTTSQVEPGIEATPITAEAEPTPATPTTEVEASGTTGTETGGELTETETGEEEATGTQTGEEEVEMTSEQKKQAVLDIIQNSDRDDGEKAEMEILIEAMAEETTYVRTQEEVNKESDQYNKAAINLLNVLGQSNGSTEEKFGYLLEQPNQNGARREFSRVIAQTLREHRDLIEDFRKKGIVDENKWEKVNSMIHHACGYIFLATQEEQQNPNFKLPYPKLLLSAMHDMIVIQGSSAEEEGDTIRVVAETLAYLTMANLDLDLKLKNGKTAGEHYAWKLEEWAKAPKRDGNYEPMFDPETNEPIYKYDEKTRTLMLEESKAIQAALEADNAQ